MLFCMTRGFGGQAKRIFSFLQRVASLFLYSSKSYCEHVRSLFNWSSNKYERGVVEKVIVML